MIYEDLMLALKNLVKNKLRTCFTILGVALAVLSIILLSSIGNGLLTTGGRLLEESTIHLWITGETADIASQYSGSGVSKISDAHKFAQDFRENKDINMVTPMLTEMVYAYKGDSEPKAVFGLGLEGSGGNLVNIIEGKDLTTDEHYNKGTYNGKWKKEVIIDSRTAGLLQTRVGDTIHIGKTLTDAKQQEFIIIGLADSLSKFSANPMIVLYLSEFQDITGNKYYDSVNMIILRLNNPEKAIEIQNQLIDKYPQYTISTNQEYLKKAIKQNSLPLASAGSIVVLAIIMGAMLAINTMLISLNERKKEIAIMKVIGMNQWSVFKSIATEGLLISLMGGTAGIIISIPLTDLINSMIHEYIGFDNLVVIQQEYMYLGLAVAITIGIVTSFLAVIHISRMNMAELLRNG